MMTSHVIRHATLMQLPHETWRAEAEVQQERNRVAIKAAVRGSQVDKWNGLSGSV